jgi:hypothetical protein
MKAPSNSRIELTCDGCSYRTRLDPDCSRRCPACLGWLRLDYIQAVVPLALPMPARPRRQIEATPRWRRTQSRRIAQ